jgi:hypothetical protein
MDAFPARRSSMKQRAKIPETPPMRQRFWTVAAALSCAKGMSLTANFGCFMTGFWIANRWGLGGAVGWRLETEKTLNFKVANE